jgi:hypothetical protein
MASDYKVTLQDFLDNECFSAKHFKNHFLYFIQNKTRLYPDLDYTLYRYKIVIWTDPAKKYHLKVHHHGKSRKYVTVVHPGTRKELATLHCDIPPKILLDMVYHYLKT